MVEAEEGLAAAILLRVFDMPSGQRVGLVAWVMTDPVHRGRGLAPALVGRGLARLEEMGCGRILTEIEGHNTASMAVFRRTGFRPVGLRGQIAEFGPLGAALLRIRTRYAFDPGHALWLKDHAHEGVPEARQRIAVWGLNWLFALLALALGGGLLQGGPVRVPSGPDTLHLLVAVVLVLGLREAAMRLAAGARGLPVTFRGWDSGLGITAPIALLFGRLFPLPGSVYPRDPDWRYPDALPALGAAALAGVGALAAIVAVALLVVTTAPGTTAAAFAGSVLLIGKPLLLFDTVLPFPPFQAFAARRIYDFSRFAWLGAAAVGLALFLL